MKIKNVQLSIVVPVYNVSRYLRKNIEAMFRQTKKNIEFIYIDDGSNDGSAFILDEYKKKDERMRVFHNSNHGVSYTRNFGIENACGKYITFVDGDDYIDEDYAEYLLELIGYSKLPMAISLKHHINESILQDVPLFIEDRNSQDIINDIYTNKIFMAVWNKIYEKNFLDKNNIRFDESIWYAEGMHFNIQCLSNLDKITVGNKMVYHYISNPDSAMRKGFNIANEKCALKSLDMQRIILSEKLFDTNTLEYHYLMVCYMILCGILQTGTEKEYIKDIKYIKKIIKERKFIPFKVGFTLKESAKWYLIGCFPMLMSRRELIRKNKMDNCELPR